MEQKEYKTAYEYYLSLPKYGKQQVLSYKGFSDLQTYIAKLRKEKIDPKFICAQPGFQTQFMAVNCKQTFLWGNRGGGKTFICFLKVLPYTFNPLYTGFGLRKAKAESDKPGGLSDTSKIYFNQFAEYAQSQNIREWRFNSGSRFKFEYFSDEYESFVDRFQGGQLFNIIVDEAGQCDENIWNYLRTTNRSPMTGKPFMLGAMNPNPDSFLYGLIQWWIDENGAAIPERSGVTKYYYKYGNTDEDIIWGFTKREVYAKGKHIIDEAVTEKEWKMWGDKAPLNLIAEICFVACDLSDNEILLTNQPDYKASLATGDEKVDNINLKGVWKRTEIEGDIITDTDMLNFFQNTPQYDDGMEYATLDPAYGSDMAVMCHWIGHHLQDLQFTKDVDGSTIIGWIRGNLERFGLSPDRLAFDAWGANNIKAEFKTSKPILGAVIDIRNRIRNEQAKFLYTDLKSQMADALISRLREKGYSMNPALLGLQYGNGTVRKIMMRQKSAIRFKPQTVKGKMSIIEKGDMKKILGGGESPDLIEAILYREYWDLVKPITTVKKSKLNSLMFI